MNNQITKTQLTDDFSHVPELLAEFFDVYGDYGSYNIDDVCAFFEVFIENNMYKNNYKIISMWRKPEYMRLCADCALDYKDRQYKLEITDEPVNDECDCMSDE